MMLIPVVLSGGAGTRLWPVSREGYPKPFMKLPDGQTLLEKAYARAAALIPQGGPIITVTNREHYFASKDQFAKAGLSLHRAHFLLEPEGRNTAPAIAVAAQLVAREYGPDALMVVMAADHLIQDIDAFQQATLHALELARQDYLVTYGIQPTRAETGFGYIQVGEKLDAVGGCKVLRFVEKPDLVTAQQYLKGGGFLWNSGMFCFSAGAILKELGEHAAQMAEKAGNCIEASSAQESAGVVFQELEASSFAKLEDVSIDYAVMERSNRVAVIPVSFGWSDIGSWNALSQLLPADAQNNRVQGDVVLLDTRNTFVLGDNRLIATVGVDDLVIVDTADALLVARADKDQEVRQVAKELKLRNHDAYRLHRTVTRPWGTYTVLEEGARFKIKRIVVKPGGSLSLQMHHHRSEHWIVVKGMARVIKSDDEPRLINTNESTFIPAGHKHRLENPGVIDLVMIEVQSGEYLGEDDIVRFEDHYGRLC